jgi:pilus assembly protein CpaE
MSGVILATDSRDLARRVRIASNDDLTVLLPEQVPTGPAQLLAVVDEPEAVRSVILDIRHGNGQVQAALDLASRFDEQFPAVSVLLVTPDTHTLGLPALRAGVKDLIEPDTAVEDIRFVIRRAIEAPRSTDVDPAAATADGRVITVASPKGGVGKTTLATNIAAALARQSPQGTVLVDLDVQFGDVAAALDLNPMYTLADMVDGTALADAIHLKTLLTQHSSGLQVACGVHSPVEADRVSPQHIHDFLGLLKAEFRYVVIDTAPGMSEQTLTALDHTTDLVLITSLDVPGVRGLKKELELLDELDLPPATRHVVVNFVDKDGGLAVRDVEATIARSVDLEIPRSPKVPRSTNQGSPIVVSAPKDRISKDITELVTRFAPARVTNGGFGRHRWGLS